MCLFLVLLFNQLVASRFIFTQNLVWQLLVFVAIRLNPHVIREFAAHCDLWKNLEGHGKHRCMFWELSESPIVVWQGPEIRTGELKDGKPIQLVRDKEITITTDYSVVGDENTIAMSYKKLPEDVHPGTAILCSDGTITLTVLETDEKNGTVRCRCENTAMLGEKKNVNLPGIVVDLPTITKKDIEDILGWGVKNKIDFIAASFVRKGEDLRKIRALLGPHAATVQIISKVC